MATKRRTGGRKPGVPNKATALVRERIETEADPVGLLTRIARGEEIDGDKPTLEQRAHAARWLGAKVIPDAKEIPLALDVGEVQSPTDAIKAAGVVIAAAGKGAILPGEAKAMMDLLGGFMRAYEVSELETRVKALEEAK